MKKYKIFLLIIVLSFFCSMIPTYAANGTKACLTGDGVRLRSSAQVTSDNVIYTVSRGTALTLTTGNKITGSGCSNDWYEITYKQKTLYVCSSFISIGECSTTTDSYDRPWTSPRLAIIGGAKFIAKNYISKGQFTSYLKKFNVNPNGYYSVYNHQYMANLQAPSSEASTSYKSYSANNLLSLSLEFTIPIFNNMPEYTTLPGKAIDNSCQSEVVDSAFETKLDAEGFTESYKCKLRLLHGTYSNWTFKSLKTNLDFSASVTSEQAVSSINGNEDYYDKSTGNKVQTEPGWYKANYNTVAYFLDPRNFLKAEKILMFENLSYSDNYTEAMAQTILNGTFMAEYSLIDNKTYASIFVEAGKSANVSPIYLASLAKQEVGVDGSKATSGASFTYDGVTYVGLYNFYNIGAYSSESSPVLAGLVWASGGSESVIVGSDSYVSEEEKTIFNKIGAVKKNNCITNLTNYKKMIELKTALAGLSVSISGAYDEDNLKTGQTISISDGTTNYSYSLVIKGDVDGDGEIKPTDYVRIKNYIMETKNSTLNVPQSLAADMNNNNKVGPEDYVLIKNSIMSR